MLLSLLHTTTYWMKVENSLKNYEVLITKWDTLITTTTTRKIKP